MTDYLITTEPGEHHRLSISWSVDRRLLFLCTNSRTITVSPSMGKEISRALMACIDGGFDRALSLLALELEVAESSRRAARMQTPNPPSPTPELDQL